mgnify:CR=1 FL=1
MNLLYRSLTSFIYVGLLLGSLYFSHVLFSFVACVITVITLWEIQRITHQKAPLTYLFFPVLFFGSTYSHTGETLTLVLGTLGVIFSILFLKNRNKKAFNSVFITTLSLIGIAAPMVLLALLGAKKPELAVFVFGIIWLNDSGAFLIGSWKGKRPLSPTISPNKTIEGSLGGLIITLIVMSFLNDAYFNLLPTNLLLPIVLITAIMASLGDLVQSKLKRQCNVKDSGKILPGHGGMYDRIDSTLLAIPVYTLILFLSGYVS